MKKSSRPFRMFVAFVALALFGNVSPPGAAAAVRRQDDKSDTRSKAKPGGVRSVTIPVTVSPRSGREIVAVDFKVTENGEAQSVLSVRGAENVPLSLAVLIQDDIVSSISLEIKALGEFIRRLPRGSRVMVGYLRSGSLQVRQKFTTDTEKAAAALRIPVSSSAVAPYNPYVEIVEALKRFESLPTGRRAVIVISDGVDLSRGFDSASPTQSLDLRRAINESQRRGVAVYSIYAPTVGTRGSSNQLLIGYGQGSLNLLSDDTGGKAFFQGTEAPVSIDPYLKEISTLLSRQIALTYLSTHPGKGFHRISVSAGGQTETVEIKHPAGYTK